VEQLKNQLIKIANSTYAGRYIFSGFKTNTRLMDDDGYFTMDVANSEAIIYQIGISDSININVPGGDLVLTAELMPAPVEKASLLRTSKLT